MLNKVYVTTAFKGHNPVGVAAYAVAPTAARAAELLNSELYAQKLPATLKGADMRLVCPSVEQAVILNNGDY